MSLGSEENFIWQDQPVLLSLSPRCCEIYFIAPRCALASNPAIYVETSENLVMRVECSRKWVNIIGESGGQNGLASGDKAIV